MWRGRFLAAPEAPETSGQVRSVGDAFHRSRGKPRGAVPKEHCVCTSPPEIPFYNLAIGFTVLFLLSAVLARNPFH